jgi:hypothetical protein
MRHGSGEVLNLLGPADSTSSANILRDVDAKHPGITHVSYKVTSVGQQNAFWIQSGSHWAENFRIGDCTLSSFAIRT